MANKKDQAEVMEQASTEQNVAAVETQETPVDELSTEQVAAMDEKDTADQAAAEKKTAKKPAAKKPAAKKSTKKTTKKKTTKKETVDKTSDKKTRAKRTTKNKVTPKIEVDLLRESLVNRLAIVAKANDNKIQNRQVMDAIEEKDLDLDEADAIFNTLEEMGIEVTANTDEEDDYETALDIHLKNEVINVDDPVLMYLKEIGRVDLLTADEERELAMAMEQSDLSAKDHLCEANLRLVVSIAKLHWSRYAISRSDPRR